MMVKGTIFIDLDGTLIDKDYAILDQDIEAIKEALSLDYKVVLISGRPLKFVMWIRDQIDARIHTIGFNGAQIEGQEPLVLEQASVDALLPYSNQAIFKSHTGYYTTAPSLPEVFQYTMLQDFPRLPKELFDFTKVIKVLIFTEAHAYPTVVEAMKQIPNVTLSAYEPKGLELSHISVNKGNAIKRYVDGGVKIYGIGDDVNDIPMFEVSDQYYVMNDRFGGIHVSHVYEAIHKILKGGN